MQMIILLDLVNVNGGEMIEQMGNGSGCANANTNGTVIF